MKFRYFLRGVGVGIIFSSIVCLVAYQSAAAGKMTEEEIRKEAEKLGMVEKEDPLEDLLTTQNNQEKSQKENADSEEETQKTETETANQKSEEQTTEVTTETTTEQATETKTETTEQEEKVTIKIEKGSTSYTVCQKLQELGMIEDASEFDTYLVKNGYASRIRVGEHTLKKGMEYHDIAEAISDPA